MMLLFILFNFFSTGFEFPKLEGKKLYPKPKKDYALLLNVDNSKNVIKLSDRGF